MILHGGSTQQNPRLPVGVSEQWLSRYPPPPQPAVTEVSSVARAGPGFYSVPSGQQAACLTTLLQPGSVSGDGLPGEALERSPQEALWPSFWEPRPGV